MVAGVVAVGGFEPLLRVGLRVPAAAPLKLADLRGGPEGGDWVGLFGCWKLERRSLNLLGFTVESRDGEEVGEDEDVDVDAVAGVEGGVAWVVVAVGEVRVGLLELLLLLLLLLFVEE